MGALHAGHMALVERAAADGAAVLVSIFVNPTQFSRPEDLASYPRDEAGDLAKLRDAGCDYLLHHRRHHADHELDALFKPDYRGQEPDR